MQELKDLVKTIPSTLDKEHLRSFARLIGLTLGRGHTSMSTEKMWADIQAWADDSPERVWNLHELRCVTDSTLKRLAWQTHGLGDDTAVTRSKLATKVAVERRTVSLDSSSTVHGTHVCFRSPRMSNTGLRCFPRHGRCST